MLAWLEVLLEIAGLFRTPVHRNELDAVTLVGRPGTPGIIPEGYVKILYRKGNKKHLPADRARIGKHFHVGARSIVPSETSLATRDGFGSSIVSTSSRNFSSSNGFLLIFGFISFLSRRCRSCGLDYGRCGRHSDGRT
jgi:hypothetical protein